jgi:hypothetical protein
MATDKKDLYKRIKIAGILSFIPFILLGGALFGYLMGSYLEKKIAASSFIIFPITVALGMLVSVIEVIRIIKLAVKISESR